MIILDTSFIVAYSVEMDEHHAKTVGLMEKILGKEFGKIYISDFIFDETITVVFNKSKKLESAIKVGENLQKSFEIIEIDKSVFEEAWNIFKTQKETRLGFTDCTTLAVMSENSIKKIATFDREFKKIVWTEAIGLSL